MSTKSLKTQLLAAVAMCLVAVIALGSSTFAWFAANNKVTATDMTVTAKSNSQYLIIDDDDNAADETGVTEKVAKFISGGTNAAGAEGTPAANTDKIIYPAFYTLATETSMPGTKDGETGTTVTGLTASTWYTANNKNAGSATDATKNIKAINDETGLNLDNYRLLYKSWLSLTKDSESYTGKIDLEATMTAGTDAAVTVLVKLTQDETTEIVELYGTGESLKATTENDFTITSTSSVAVEYYVYIDGTSTNVNSNFFNADGNEIKGGVTVAFSLK